MGKQSPIQTNASGQFREIVTDAIGYWQRRRILYNVILATVVALWFMVHCSEPCGGDGGGGFGRLA
jgi:hypothetical protein